MISSLLSLQPLDYLALISQRKKIPLATISTIGSRTIIQTELAHSLRDVVKQSQVCEASPTGFVVGSTTGPRRERNEDRVCAVTISGGPINGGPKFLCALCDGIGGEKDGERSAWNALAAFTSQCVVSTALDCEHILNDAANLANDLVFEFTRGQGGTTLAAVLMNAEGQIFGLNCGDSRIYSYSKNSGLKQLSTDQTLAAAIEHAVAALPKGALLQEFGENLGNFIGIGPDLSPEFFDIGPLSSEEVIILASDGIWNALEGMFPKILHAAPNYSEAVRRILSIVNLSGGSDNASIAVFSPRAIMQSHFSKDDRNFGTTRLSGISPNGQISVAVQLQSLFSLEGGAKSEHIAVGKKTRAKAQRKPQIEVQQPDLPIEQLITRSKTNRSRSSKRKPRIVVVEEDEADGKGANGEHATN